MLKSIYVSLYMTAGFIGLIVALIGLSQNGLQSAWLGAAIACAGPSIFFPQIMLMPRARTSPNLYAVIAAGVVGTLLSLFLAGFAITLPVLVAAVVGIVGSLVYVFWYSHYGAPASGAVREGIQLPEMEFTENGTPLKSSELVTKPALWVFYRGNWCPLCSAQIKEISAQYRELSERGVEVFLVSPQPEANSVALSKKMDAPMRFLTDPENRAAEKLGILVESGLPAGLQALGYDSDVPRPTVFITEAGGKVIFCDMTDNYRVRPEPATYFSVLDRHAIG